MAIQFVGGNVAAKTGATSGNSTIALNSGLTGGIASAVSAGDLVIAVFATGSTANRTLAITDGSFGYTLIASELYQDDSFDTNLRVAYKFMGGTPDASTTFGPTGSINDAGAMAVYVFRGVDATTPLDVAAVPGQAASTSRVVPPDITPTTAGAFVVVAGAAAHNGGTDTFTSSDLTDFRTVGGNDSNDVTLGIGHQDNWSGGATNYATWGHSQTNSTSFSWAAMTIALRPAADTTDELVATGVAAGAPSLGSPAIEQIHDLGAAAVSAGAPSIGAPVIHQAHDLAPIGLSAGAPTLGAPAAHEAHVLDATGITTGAPTTGAPAIGQAHVLAADTLASGAPSSGAPAITQTHELAAGGVDAGVPAPGSPAIGQAHVLAAVALAAGAPSLAAPGVGQIHVLGAEALTLGAPTLGTPALGEPSTQDDLEADGVVAGTPALWSPGLSQVHILVAGWLNLGSPVLGEPWLNKPPAVPGERPQGATAWDAVRFTAYAGNAEQNAAHGADRCKSTIGVTER